MKRFFLIITISLNFLFAQESIYIAPKANLVTHPDSKIAIFGDIINDAKGGFTHNDGGEVFIYRHENNGKGSSKIIDGPNSSIGIDNNNTEGSFCKFWILHTDNTTGKSESSHNYQNFDSGTGHIRVEQEIVINRKHYLDKGMIWTPRNNMNHAFIKYEADQYGNYTSIWGASDSSHIDGYAAQSGLMDFYFPTGDGKIIRGCGTSSQKGIQKAAYYNRNPLDYPNYIDKIKPTIKDSNNLGEYIIEISKTEFWDFDGLKNGLILLISNNRKRGYSEFSKNFKNSKDIVIAGFDGKWRNLGKYVVNNQTSDTIFSSLFQTNLDSNFSMFTFAGVDSSFNIINYEKNNDGKFIYFESINKNQIKVIYSLGYFGIGTLKVFNLIGKEILSEKIDFNEAQNTFEINTEKMTDRFYIIQIQSDKNDIINAKFLNKK